MVNFKKSYFLLISVLIILFAGNLSADNNEKIKLIREIEELKYELENKDWTWFNKEEKDELKERKEHLENIIDKIKNIRLEK